MVKLTKELKDSGLGETELVSIERRLRPGARYRMEIPVNMQTTPTPTPPSSTIMGVGRRQFIAIIAALMALNALAKIGRAHV